MDNIREAKTAPKGALFTVFLTVLIDLMGFGIVLPLLPFYAATFNASAVQIGLLYSVYSLMQLVFSPFWGSLSDRIGRRPIMLISTFGSCVAYLIFGFSHSLWILFFSRFIAGVMGGNISTAQAYVTDVTAYEDRSKGMGLIGAAFGIGFVMGPAISTLLIHPFFLNLFGISQYYKFATPGFFASLLSFLSFLLVFFKLPETVNVSQVKEARSNQENGGRILRSSIFSRNFWTMITHESGASTKYLFLMLMLCIFLLSFAQATLYSAFPLFCKGKLDFSAEEVGMIFVYMGLVAVIIQGGLIKRLTHIYSEKKLFLIGSILMVLGLGLIPFAHHKPLLVTFILVMSVGGSLNGPTLNSLISKTADPSKVGATLGTSQGIASLGRVIGPTWGGILFDVSYIVPFIATAILTALTIAVGFKLNRKD